MEPALCCPAIPEAFVLEQSMKYESLLQDIRVAMKRESISESEFRSISNRLEVSCFGGQSVTLVASARIGVYHFKSFKPGRSSFLLRWQEEDSLILKTELADRLLNSGAVESLVPIFRGKDEVIEDFKEIVPFRRFDGHLEGNKLYRDEINCAVIGKVSLFEQLELTSLRHLSLQPIAQS